VIRAVRHRVLEPTTITEVKMKRIPRAVAIALAASAGASGALAVSTAGAAPVALAASSYTALAASSYTASAASSYTASTASSDTVKVVHTGLGKLLVDQQGLTLYMFTHDSRNTDTCGAIKDCFSVWPALTTKKKPTAGPGVKASLLGTIKIGKRIQVTYAGHPLYEYAQNDDPGATGYIGTPEFGGHWYGVSPTGKPVK
jgi:predicted lipoprotein with Yx(FWY)xxD motif